MSAIQSSLSWCTLEETGSTIAESSTCQIPVQFLLHFLPKQFDSKGDVQGKLLCNWNLPLFLKLETTVSLDFVGKILRAIHFSCKAVAMASSLWSNTSLVFCLWTNKYLWECNIYFLTVAKIFAFKQHSFIVALVINVLKDNSDNNYFSSSLFLHTHAYCFLD